MRITKILGIGLLNYLIRFAVGGVLMMGVKMDPEGLAFGVILTVVAFLAAIGLLRFVIKPATLKEALTVAVSWVIIALILDILTAQPIVKVPASYLLSELQTWTRLAAILLAAPLAVSGSRGSQAVE